MSSTHTSLPAFNVIEGDREDAVNAALELLRAYCLGGNAKDASEPDEFFNRLSEYADKILEAVAGKSAES